MLKKICNKKMPQMGIKICWKYRDSGHQDEECQNATVKNSGTFIVLRRKTGTAGIFPL
jgi:hypothetical protein